VLSLVPESVISAAERADQYSMSPMRAGAPPDVVEQVNRRLGGRLPRDLLSFYSVSDGWHQYGFDECDLDVLQIQELSALPFVAESVRNAAISYASSDPEHAVFRRFRESDVVVLGHCRSGMYLMDLSAEVQSAAERAYVIRFHATPKRFHSFSAMMIAERNRCLQSLRSLLGFGVR
jgi:hypothetical protein